MPDASASTEASASPTLPIQPRTSKPWPFWPFVANSKEVASQAAKDVLADFWPHSVAAIVAVLCAAVLPDRPLVINLTFDFRACACLGLFLFIGIRASLRHWAAPGATSQSRGAHDSPHDSPVKASSLPDDIVEELMREIKRLKPPVSDDSDGKADIDSLHNDMLGASPALAHRIPASAVERTSGYWSSPPFTARGRCFSLRMGPLGGSDAGSASSKEAKYFCLLPHGHEERLRCSIFFARRPGEGYRERRVHDWPKELAGHPWGPTVQMDELRQLKQADGSLLLMVHVAGLGDDEDQPVGTDGATGGNRSQDPVHR